MKAIVQDLIKSVTRLVLRTRVGRFIGDYALQAAIGQTAAVTHGGLQLIFAVPNGLNRMRIDTFSTKEPETLEWIDTIPSNAVFWDVGANIGLYSCYAARARKCRTFAFEPSVYNLELLARNIYLNHLTETVTIVPLPLSEKLEINTLRMSTTDWGGALSTFGRNFGQDGQPLSKVFEVRTVGLSMADVVKRLESLAEQAREDLGDSATKRTGKNVRPAGQLGGQ